MTRSEMTRTKQNLLSRHLADEYASELELMRAALDGVPEDHFAVSGLGHSPAWHALHLADWLRLLVLDEAERADFHYLGWEGVERVQQLGQRPAPLEEGAGKAAIMARFEAVGQQVVTALRSGSDAELEGEVFSATSESGTRPRLPALGLHLRHVAYHRGQVQLGKKGSTPNS